MTRQFFTGWVTAILFAVAASGCGDSSRLKIYPVRGEVKVAGQPAVGARVFFHPVENLGDPKGLRPVAIVEPDGSFQLTTYLTNDGAPAGDYAVTITWPTKTGADEEAGGDRLKLAYPNAKALKIKVTVKAEKNVLEPFELK